MDKIAISKYVKKNYASTLKLSALSREPDHSSTITLDSHRCTRRSRGRDVAFVTSPRSSSNVDQ